MRSGFNKAFRSSTSQPDRESVARAPGLFLRGHLQIESPFNIPYRVQNNPIGGKENPPADCGLMVSPRQIRAARALLGWSQQELADKAIVSLNALTRLENGKVDSRISTLQAIEAALIKAGVEFLSAGQKGEGVRLLDPGA